MSKSLRIIKVTAPYCQPCKTFAPVLQKIAKELETAIEAIDVEDEPKRAAELTITALPTTIVMLGDRELVRIEGAVPLNRLRTMIADALIGDGEWSMQDAD